MLKYFCLTLVLSGLYFTTFINYLLFHSIVEIISIVVACSFFMIAWNSKKYIHNQYVLFIGIAYLFIAFLDLLHTLSYKGMPIFMDYDYYANQLWIAARYMESVTLVVAFYFLGTKKTFHPEKIFAVYTMITAGIVASIFVWKIFPVCFIEGSGLTPFKKISEYIISGILCVSIVLLQKNKNRFEDHIHKMLFFSIVFTILSELAFTFYISNYGFSNLIGHYFKLFSYYLIYTAIIETAIKRPYDLIFKELALANRNLNKEIDRRKQTEKDREEIIVELQQALTQVKTLNGLIPICAHCKKIRDDNGYWNQLEAYIVKHSNATLSHGICPDCTKKYYSDLG